MHEVRAVEQLIELIDRIDLEAPHYVEDPRAIRGGAEKALGRHRDPLSVTRYDGRPQCRAVVRIPDSNDPIEAGGDDSPPVRRKRKGNHLVLMPDEAPDQPTRIGIPELDRVHVQINIPS